MIDVLVSFFTRTVKSSFRIYENMFKSYIMKFKDIARKLSKKIRDVLRETIGYILGTPKSIKDYIKTGEIYISKQFILKFLLVFAVVCFFVFNYAIPYLEGRFWTATIVVNSNKYHEFSGKARVVDKNGNTLYMGKLEDGVITGTGEVFQNNSMVYKGEMSDNKFNGDGILYEDEKIIYDGSFKDNKFEGSGKLYYENGNVKFDGTFLEGIFVNGTEYYSNGFIKYKGNYLDGKYKGDGILYSSMDENEIVYDGEFDKGIYNGYGNLYLNNKLIYKGAFVNGEYSGDGIEYSFSTGKVVYTGNFLSGIYSGEGKKYNQKTGSLIYSGQFNQGRYDGEGKLYDLETGKLIYDGSFLEGFYNGFGKQYRNDTGRLLYSGEFFDGVYNGEGILYASSGSQIFEGSFFNGDIDYTSFFNTDLETIRKSFGKEDDLYMLENSFVTIYSSMNVAFEFDFAENGQEPVSSKIKFFGTQKINEIENGMLVTDAINLLGENNFTEYNFDTTDEDAFFLNLANADIYAGEPAYSIKYIIDDYYIRIYSDSQDGKIYYYEMGGI